MPLSNLPVPWQPNLPAVPQQGPFAALPQYRQPIALGPSPAAPTAGGFGGAPRPLLMGGRAAASPFAGLPAPPLPAPPVAPAAANASKFANLSKFGKFRAAAGPVGAALAGYTVADTFSASDGGNEMVNALRGQSDNLLANSVADAGPLGQALQGISSFLGHGRTDDTVGDAVFGSQKPVLTSENYINQTKNYAGDNKVAYDAIIEGFNNDSRQALAGIPEEDEKARKAAVTEVYNHWFSRKTDPEGQVVPPAAYLVAEEAKALGAQPDPQQQEVAAAQQQEEFAAAQHQRAMAMQSLVASMLPQLSQGTNSSLAMYNGLMDKATPGLAPEMQAWANKSRADANMGATNQANQMALFASSLPVIMQQQALVEQQQAMAAEQAKNEEYALRLQIARESKAGQGGDDLLASLGE